MEAAKTIPLNFEHKDNPIEKSSEFYKQMISRRSVRDISSKPVEKEVIENILRVAASAPSGANKQPWSFCAISSATLKREIRDKAEEEEFLSYNGRMNKEWLKALKPLKTDHIKEFITEAPWIIIVFKSIYEIIGDSKVRYNNYYVNESVGIATGFLLTAIHKAGLVTVTHTPSPMNFLHQILKRPDNERPFMLLPVGYPAVNAQVPDIKKKDFEEIAFFYE
jgi:nitroreductase|tara:strand:- start:16740 stop:17405 length:666 start_codon:yes stop_codon:yes gene_type:complete